MLYRLRRRYSRKVLILCFLIFKTILYCVRRRLGKQGNVFTNLIDVQYVVIGIGPTMRMLSIEVEVNTSKYYIERLNIF